MTAVTVDRSRLRTDPGAWAGVGMAVVLLVAMLGYLFAVPGPPSDGPTIPPPVVTTTTTSTAPAPVTVATLPAAKAQPAATRVTTSTMYCLQGVTASGTHVHPGVAAVSYGRYHELLGTTWEVLTGPHAGQVFTVEDKGPLADFDMWTASCPEAENYGRHTITIRQLEEG